MKKKVISILIIGTMLIVGCSKGEEVDNVNRGENEEIVLEENKEDKPKEEKHETIINNIDFSENFNGIGGGAIFYTPDADKYDIYNEAIINEQVSPYSTFKIISTLMGLDKGIITSKDSKLGYDGKKYSNEAWNKDVTLEEAFSSSCVWYFEKLVASLDKNYVQDILNRLEYGNKDLSAWNNNGHNTFWISSSLKISPKEQIEVLRKIFSLQSGFKNEHVEVLKDISKSGGDSIYSVYGKTGSGRDTNAWFVGAIELNFQYTYFAIKIKDESIKLGGSKAKEIGIDIIEEYYVY